MTLKSFAETLGVIIVMAILYWVIICGDNGLTKCQERFSRDTCIHTLKGG